MTAAAGVACAVTFVWAGMVLAISFIETPLKFRAPDVTLRIGLGIGRLVFRALAIAEVALGLVLVTAVTVERPSGDVAVAASVALLVLLVQLAVLRPRLTRRSNAVLAGSDAPRSDAHFTYVGLEAIKVSALLATGSLLMAR